MPGIFSWISPGNMRTIRYCPIPSRIPGEGMSFRGPSGPWESPGTVFDAVSGSFHCTGRLPRQGFALPRNDRGERTVTQKHPGSLSRGGMFWEVDLLQDSRAATAMVEVCRPWGCYHFFRRRYTPIPTGTMPSSIEDTRFPFPTA